MKQKNNGELARESTIWKFRIVQNEGSRKLKRDVDFYNFHTFIAVGYRATQPVEAGSAYAGILYRFVLFLKCVVKKEMNNRNHIQFESARSKGI